MSIKDGFLCHSQSKPVSAPFAGFIFWQEGKKRYDPLLAERYEVNFIAALRKEFEVPNAKFVCATIGQTEKGTSGKDSVILDSQFAAAGECGKYLESKANVATVYSNPLSLGGSSSGQYISGAEAYMNVGLEPGRAMAELLKN